MHSDGVKWCQDTEWRVDIGRRGGAVARGEWGSGFVLADTGEVFEPLLDAPEV